jgi:hypothetical protein
MKRSQVLYISDYEVLLYDIHDKRVALCECFLHQEDAYLTFRDYMRIHPPAAIKILINSRHEEYRQERIPKLRGNDRQSLLEHKRKRLFPASPYTAAVLQGDSRKNPQQERVLFSCLTAPDLIQPWIKVLLEAHIAITGICSLPLLSHWVLKNLPPIEQVMLVTYSRRMGGNAPYSLRQSFFVGQNLCASRLIPLQGLEAEHYIGYVFNEILKTQQYLQGQGMASEEQVFTVYLLLPPHLITPLQAHLNQNPPPPYLCYYFIDINQVATLDGLIIDASAHDNDLFYFETLMAWNAVHYGKNHYALPYERRYYQYYKIRRMLLAATVVLSVGSLSYSAFTLWEAQRRNHHAEDIAHTIATIRADYQKTQQHQQQLLDIPVDVLHIKNTVEVVDYFQSLYRDPYRALLILSKHLTDFPMLTLTTLNWEHKRVAIQKHSAASKLLNTRIIRQDDSAQEMESIEILTIEGHISDFQGNTIRAVRTLRTFTQLIQAEAGVSEVNIVNSPMNITSESLTRQDETQSPFKLEIIFRFEPTSQ